MLRRWMAGWSVSVGHDGCGYAEVMDVGPQRRVLAAQQMLAEIERLPAASPARTRRARELVDAWQQGGRGEAQRLPEVDRWVEALGEQPSAHARFDLVASRLAAALREATATSA
jgi:hypothetical protein